jgi:hypothetical protein
LILSYLKVTLPHHLSEGDGALLRLDRGEEFDSSIPQLPKALIRDPLQGDFATMSNPIFTYNNPNASCALCDRIKNPHPDYSHEPIVTTRLKLHRGYQDLCINCYWDVAAATRNCREKILDIFSEKLNIRRLLQKNSPAISGHQLCQPDNPSEG